MLVDKLYKILKDIKSSQTSWQCKDDILADCISGRLSKSIDTYYKELSNCVLSLSTRDELKVMKNINKGL